MFLVPPASPHAGRSCARHVSPLSPTVSGCVPAARGCPAGGAGRSPGGAVLGLPGRGTSPRRTCGERTSGMSPALPPRDGWEELSSLGGADEIGRGLSLKGKGDLQRWALHWHLGQGWGQVTLLPVTPGNPGNPSNPRESQQSQAIPGISAHTDTNRCQGGLDLFRTPTRSGHSQSCPGWSPWGTVGSGQGTVGRASGQEEWVCLSPP